MTTPDTPPLTDLTKDEWWDVMRRVHPDLTREDFDLEWTRWSVAMRRRELQ